MPETTTLREEIARGVRAIRRQQSAARAVSKLIKADELNTEEIQEGITLQEESLEQ